MKTIISKSKLGGVRLEMETIFILHRPTGLDTEYRDDLCKAVFDYGTAMASEVAEKEINRPSNSNNGMELTSPPQFGAMVAFNGTCPISCANNKHFQCLECSSCRISLSNFKPLAGGK
jgi:hypothetical protein